MPTGHNFQRHQIRTPPCSFLLAAVSLPASRGRWCLLVGDLGVLNLADFPAGVLLAFRGQGLPPSQQRSHLQVAQRLLTRSALRRSHPAASSPAAQRLGLTMLPRSCPPSLRAHVLTVSCISHRQRTISVIQEECCCAQRGPGLRKLSWCGCCLVIQSRPQIHGWSSLLWQHHGISCTATLNSQSRARRGSLFKVGGDALTSPSKSLGLYRELKRLRGTPSLPTRNLT